MKQKLLFKVQEITSVDLPRAIGKYLYSVACSDNFYPCNRLVRVENTPKGVAIIATDGKRLVRYLSENYDGLPEGTYEIISTPRYQKDSAILWVVSCERSFPKWEKVLLSDTKPIGEVRYLHSIHVFNTVKPVCFNIEYVPMLKTTLILSKTEDEKTQHVHQFASPDDSLLILVMGVELPK